MDVGPLVESAIDAHSGGVLAAADDFADVGKISIFKVAQQNGLAVLLAEVRQRLIEELGNLFPKWI